MAERNGRPGGEMRKRAYLPAVRNRISGEYLRLLDGIHLQELEAERLHRQLVWLTGQLDAGALHMELGVLDQELDRR